MSTVNTSPLNKSRGPHALTWAGQWHQRRPDQLAETAEVEGSPPTVLSFAVSEVVGSEDHGLRLEQPIRSLQRRAEHVAILTRLDVIIERGH